MTEPRLSLDEEIKLALQNEDFEKAGQLLNEKEKKCQSLKAELRKEKSKEEEEKKKLMKERFEKLILSRIVVAEDAVSPLKIDGFNNMWVDASVRLHELTTDIH